VNQLTTQRSALHRSIYMFALISAGEAIFLLPFVLPRIFRPTVLDVFGLTNLQLGTAFSVYGFVALGAYFLGGPLADRFPARKLIAIALVATSLGGIILALIPPLGTMTILYGFWGMTTILLLWAAMIRATRIWGGVRAQGRAYGILDSGRGVFAALLASISVWLFAAVLPAEAGDATLGERTIALVRIIWIFAGLTFLAAILVWFGIPEHSNHQSSGESRSFSLKRIRKVMLMPAVWLQAIIIVCAYVGYKSTDMFSLFARDVYSYDDVAAAQIGTLAFWMRPLAAVGAGLIADRISSSKMIMWGFGLMIVSGSCFALGILAPGLHGLLVILVITTSVGIYAVRGVYFAVFEEARIPLALTGSAAGIVSVVGFTPDIFMGPLTGILLDKNPGELGHQYVFGVLAVFAFLGFIASYGFFRICRSHDKR